MSRLRNQIAWLVCIVALVGGCHGVDPSDDYERVADLVTAATGVVQVYDPRDEERVESRIADLLDGGIGADEAVQLCLLNNRRLQAAFLEIGMARADVVQAGLLSNPFIGLSFRMPSGGGLINIDAGLSQNIAELWQIPARSRAARRDLDAAVLRVARELAVAAVEARAAFYRAMAADRLAVIAAENLAIAERLLDLTETRRRAGAGSALDVNLSQAEVLEARLGRQAAELLAVEARHDLAVLVGLSTPLNEIKLVGDLPAPSGWAVDSDRLTALAIEHRLDVRAARAAVEAARARHRLERLRVLPSVEIGLSLERAERSRSKGRDPVAEIVRNSLQAGSLSRPNAPEGADTNTDLIIGPSIGLELPIFDQNQAGIARAEFAHRRAYKKYEALVRAIVQDSRLAYEKARIASEIARFFEDDLLPLRQSNLDLLREAFRVGRTNLVLVLDAQRALIAARARYIEARRDAAVTITEMEKVSGRPLAEIVDSPDEEPILIGRAMPFGTGEIR